MAHDSSIGDAVAVMPLFWGDALWIGVISEGSSTIGCFEWEMLSLPCGHSSESLCNGACDMEYAARHGY